MGNKKLTQQGVSESSMTVTIIVTSHVDKNFLIVVIRISAYLQLHQATLSLVAERRKESCV